MSTPWHLKWVERLTPAPLRPFLAYVSPSALSVIHKEAVLSLSMRISRDFLSPDSTHIESLHETVARLPLGTRLEVVERITTPIDLKALSKKDRTHLGSVILELYFHLLHHSPRVFLDLRLEHFAYAGGSSPVLFAPPRLSFTPTPEFSKRVQALYRGFYLRDSAATAEGIALYAWESEATPDFSKRMAGLLDDHFGSAATEPLKFSIEHFQKTFHLIFEEAKRSHAKFHPELAFLGMLLISLYLSLSQLDVALDVHDAYAKGAA